jgi:predicted TIM-barrel fold metal-dependent hydrolase
MLAYSAKCAQGSVLALSLTLGAWNVGCAGQIQSSPEPVVSPSAEHHLHLPGTEIMRILDAAMRAEGGIPRDAPRISAPTADAAVEALDYAEITYGLALSGGYLWGSPELHSPMLTSILDSLGLEVGDERARVRAENVYLAEQIARYPERLVGACSVNPLADYALDEVELCGADPRIGAFKLHLFNSGVDLTDMTHVTRLQALFRALENTELVAVVHLRNRVAGYGAADAGIFIREVLAAAPGVPVQIAHMAGMGYYDDATHSAMQAFVDAFEDGSLDRDRITFDFPIMVDDPSEAGADSVRTRRVSERNARLAERMRQVGIERIVFGTDWPFFPPGGDPRTGIARYRAQLRSVLPLEPEELDRFFSNIGPMFRR